MFHINNKYICFGDFFHLLFCVKQSELHSMHEFCYIIVYWCVLVSEDLTNEYVINIPH